MRKFAWTLAALCSLTLGCNAPVETIPAVTPEPEASSGTTAGEGHEGHDHAHGDHDHAPGDTKDAGAEAKAEEAKTEGVEVTDAKAEGAPEAKTEAAAEPSASTAKPELIRFVADKRINVPEMMCPYSCWPKVKETLAAQAGVEAVQLAEQPAGTAEGEIKERVVELKLNGDFNADDAIAALAKVSFKAELAK